MNASYPGHHSPHDDVGFTSLARALWDARALILLPALGLGLLAFLLFSIVTPTFTSEAQLLVENRENAFTRPVDDNGGGFGDSQALLDQAAVRSQVQLLQSRDLALAVSKRLDLASKSEFDPLVDGSSIVTRILVVAGFARDPELMTAEERVLESFSDALDVFAIEESRVISVLFSSEDPQLAADVVNTIVDEYLVLQRDAKQATTREATQWLSNQIDNLRQSVADAEEKVATFRADSGLLVGLNDETLNAQQLSELNSQLILAQAQKSEAHARSEQIKALLRTGAAIDGSSDVVQSELINRLQERLINLRTDRAELLSTLLPRHPRIQEIDAEISGLRQQIRNEMERIARALESEAEVAGAREASVRAELEALKTRVSGTSEEEVELRALEREAAAQRDLLEALLARFREASARQSPEASLADARVISRPTVSNAPETPTQGIAMIGVAFIVAMIMAGLVLARALMRIANAPQQPAMAMHQAPIEPVVTAPPPPVDTAARAPEIVSRGPSLRDRLASFGRVVDSGNELQSIVLSGRASGRRTVMVTTGQTYDMAVPISLALARSLSQSGHKTVLIDAALSDVGASEKDAGFGALISGRSSFSDVIEKDPGSRVHIISRGGQVENPRAILGTGRTQMVFTALLETYDFVVVATPPVTRSPEARSLAAIPDHIALLALTHDDVDVAVEARDTLTNAGAQSVLAYIPEPSSPGLAAA
ncbi:MAG: exopolysaccharide transport family protein [Pseudomonadota bacterium]